MPRSGISVKIIQRNLCFHHRFRRPPFTVVPLPVSLNPQIVRLKFLNFKVASGNVTANITVIQHIQGNIVTPGRRCPVRRKRIGHKTYAVRPKVLGRNNVAAGISYLCHKRHFFRYVQILLSDDKTKMRLFSRSVNASVAKNVSF